MIWSAINLRQSAREFLSCSLLISLITIASFSNYQDVINLFWLSASMKFIVFGLLGLLGLLLLVSDQINIRTIGTIDIAVFSFLIYTLANSIIKSLPNLPPEDSYILIILLVYYILMRCWSNHKEVMSIGAIIIGIAILATFQAFLGILQQYGVISPYGYNFKASGTFINPGIYGCFLMIGLLTSISLLVNRTNTPVKYMIYVSIPIVILLALIYSGSRTAWLSLFWGVSCIYLVKSNRKTVLKNRNIFFVLLAVIVFLIGVYFVIRMNTFSIDGRFLIWKISMPMFMVNPMTGLGYGSFFIQYGNYQSNYFLNGNASESEIQLVSMNYYSFNEYLKILIEEGIIGLMLFILLIGSIVTFIYRNISGFIKNDHFLLLTILPVGSAVLLFALFSYPSQDISISLILLSFIAWISSKQVENINSWHIKMPNKKSMNYCIAFVCGFMVLVSVVKIQAIFRWKWAKENILLQEGTSLNTYAGILPILSNNGTFLYNYSAELNDLGMLREANTLLKSAAIYGNSVELQLKTAENYAKLGQLRFAEQYYLKAANMNPKLFVPFNDLLDFYLETNQKIKAQDLAVMICKKKIKISSPSVLEIKDKACKYIK
ncbi:O-antigen ligase family protein [Sphingobacterium anhuiense]|uniref:O-antigen ligase family protein n=1 Tax=Sphingobacterium anhuiense TaxID=493780 RepID=UPI003C2C41FD